MRDLKDAKKIYDNIVVPEELESRLQETLKNASPKKEKGTLVRFSRWALGAVAALLICFTAGLNTSQAFAMEAGNLPIIGTIAKVLTIRSYETKEDTTTTKVAVPEIQADTDNEEVANAITDINAEIQSIVDEFTARKNEEIAEYKEAFFATGGTEEEWNSREIDLNVNYEVKHQDEKTLSLLVDAWAAYINFQEERHFYNIDLTTGKELTLKDLLGEDAYAYAEKEVRAQIDEKLAADPDLSYWGINDDGYFGEFAGVNETTPFYINEAGNVVISYDKYEIAPGYMGVQEFEIPAR